MSTTTARGIISHPVRHVIRHCVRHTIGSPGTGYDPNAFVVVFDTNLRAGSTTVELNINARTGTANRTVDWGDGTVTVENAALPSHTYAADGVYVVQVKGGTTTRLGERGTAPNDGWRLTVTRVIQWGTLGWANFDSAFRDHNVNVEVPSSIPSTVTTLSRMFSAASGFENKFNRANIAAWNTSNVTSMIGVFVRCDFNHPIDSWNVSSVTDMNNMFLNSLFNQSLGSWALRLAGVNLTSMLNNSGLSTENYSRTLVGWANYAAANSNTPASVTLGAASRTYNATVYAPGATYTNAVDARAFLTAAAPSPAWTITDGGVNHQMEPSAIEAAMTGIEYNIPAGYNAVRVWVREYPMDDPFADTSITAVGTKTYKLGRYESRVISCPSRKFTINSTSADQILIAPDVARSSLPSSFPVNGTANADQAGPPLWQPTAAHITLGADKAFEIVSNGTRRIVFIAESNGTTWTTPRWVRVPEAGGVRVHCTFTDVALATYSGDTVEVNAVSGSTIGGTKHVMHLDIPAPTGTTHNVSDVAGLKTAIAAAVAGDEIVLADGTYLLDVNVTEASFVANHNVGGRKGMEGITIRSGSDDRSACSIKPSASSGVGNWNINHLNGTRDTAAVRGITFDFDGSTTAQWRCVMGCWRVENCRFTNTGGTMDCFVFGGSSTVIDQMLDLICLRVSADNSNNDCFDGISGKTSDSAVFIDCVGEVAGAVVSNQCMTTHNGLNVTLYGGVYRDAIENVFANGSANERTYAFFVSLERGARAVNYLNSNLYACEAQEGGHAGERTDGAAGPRVGCILGLNIREASPMSRVIVGNWFNRSPATVGSTSSFFPNVASQVQFDFNIGSGTNSMIRVDNGTGSATVRQNTAVGVNVGVAMTSGSMVVTARGNATKTTATRALDITSGNMANLTTDYNVWGTPVDVDLVPGPNDLNGTDAALDSLYFPTAGGNCDGNGDPNLFTWLGGTDAWGYALRLSSTVADRGARMRPRIIAGAELLPDLW
jgi:hypothetical protein